jgi:hypothetical protein
MRYFLNIELRATAKLYMFLTFLVVVYVDGWQGYERKTIPRRSNLDRFLLAWTLRVVESSVKAAFVKSIPGMRAFEELVRCCRVLRKVQSADSAKSATSQTRPLQESVSPSVRTILRLLGSFRWFCGRANREHIELAIADLRKDIREMEAEHRSQRFVSTVVAWRSAATIWGIVGDRVAGFFRGFFAATRILR